MFNNSIDSKVGYVFQGENRDSVKGFSLLVNGFNSLFFTEMTASEYSLAIGEIITRFVLEPNTDVSFPKNSPDIIVDYKFSSPIPLRLLPQNEIEAFSHIITEKTTDFNDLFINCRWLTYSNIPYDQQDCKIDELCNMLEESNLFLKLEKR